MLPVYSYESFQTFGNKLFSFKIASIHLWIMLGFVSDNQILACAADFLVIFLSGM